MDTWRSDTGDDDGEVIDLLSVDDYDATKAKVQASLSWVLHKAYEDQVPPEFSTPFYERGEGDWQIKPRLANLLANSELYCQACRNMFGENASQWQGHWSIIQVLSRKGIYAVGTDSTDVTETILMQTSPFKIKAHLALIDALMLAFSREIITIERVTQSVRRFASFNASSELPADLEDAILFWINKVCVTVQQRLNKSQTGSEVSETIPKDPMESARDQISVPIMENFMADVGDGCSLAVLLSFYCPQIVKIEDVYLKSIVGIADSLYNLRLIRTFCDKYIPNKTCHFTYEDMLYSKEPLKENFLVMVSELFYWFEIKPLSVVTGGGRVSSVTAEDSGQRPATTGKVQPSSKVPSVPISSITKQSFQRLKADSELRSSSTPDIHKLSPSAPLQPRVPLLHKRHQQGTVHDDHSVQSHGSSVQRAHSLTSKDLKTGSVPRESVLAWQEKGLPDDQNALPDTDRTGSNLLANVSIDSEMNGSFSSGSIDLGDLEPTPRTDRTYTHAAGDNMHTIQFSLQNKQQTPHPGEKQLSDDMNLESVTSGMSDIPTHVSQSGELQKGENFNDTEGSACNLTPLPSDGRGVNLHVEPLMPARLKPLKEKTNIHTKEEERGDNFSKKKVPSPPRVKKGVDFNSEVETINRSVDISGSDDSFTEGQVTPLPADQISPRGMVITGHPASNLRQDFGTNNYNSGIKQSPKKFEAFFIRGSLGESQDMLSQRSDLNDDGVVKESFTISDEIHTPEAARAAGIPIIDSSEHQFVRQASREGSIASSRSSGDFSDHESRKIHFDHKTRESTENKPGQKQDSSHVDMSSAGQFIYQKPVIVTRVKDSDKSSKSMATNFAEIKQMKQLGNVDNSGLIYMQQGQDGEDKKNPLKDVFQKNKTEKKTSFAPLPNQRTWQQSVTTANQNQEPASGSSNGGTTSQELLKIKMKLEEKRKAIERKKHTQEIQQQKLRQRLGKAAFMHVIAKPKEEDEINEEEVSNGRPTTLPPARMTTSDPQVQVAPEVSHRNTMNTSASSPRSATNTTPQKVSRPFSRDDIQQTIENVKKKWFNGDNTVSARTQDEEYSQQRAESPERSRPQRSLSVESQNTNSNQRTSPRRDSDTAEKGEKYEEYNSSLDKLNQSLTDLQGEIMKLSLKQKQSGQQVANNLTADSDKQNKNDVRSRSRSPPTVLEVKSKVPVEPAAERATDSGRPRAAQLRSSSEPRQIVSEPAPEGQIGNYQSHTLPRHPTYQQNQVSPFMMQGHVTVAGPAGPVYSNPNQFVPVTGMVPTPQQYGSYLMGPTHPQQMGPIPPQQITPPYQQSPPHMYPQTAPMYAQPFPQQNIISPQTQPFPAMYPTQQQPQYQPHPHIASTYTTPSHPQQPPYSQPMSVTQQPEPAVNRTLYTQDQRGVPVSRQTVSEDVHVKSQLPSAKREPDNNKNTSSNVTETLTQDDGFFIAMHEGSPRKQKPQLSDKKGKTEVQVSSKIDREQDIVFSENKQIDNSNNTEQSSYESSVIEDFAQKVTEQRPDLDKTGTQSDASESKLDDTGSSGLDTTGVGFVIGQDESSLDQSAELEMQKKKDKIAQMRLRRQEEQEMKRQKKEQELQKKKEAERLRQEESERRKSEEKARREQIFKQYLEKKEEDEEGPKKRDEKKQKPRPKSMFVRVGPGANLDEGLDNSASTEDLSARTGLTADAGRNNSTVSRGPRSKHIPSPSRTMRKAVSCNTLDQKHPASGGAGDGKTLAFGGLTHRRPPSPDLYKIRKGPRSNEGSDAGSATGVPVGADYTGPKLFVKPSAKSNRHIIINAISHCCLAGSVNTELKNKVLEEIAKSNAKHFLILFRDASCGYRGLYGFDPDSEDVTKLMGVGPRQISNKMVEKYYKYNSGAKSFSEVSSTKHVSVSIDAISLQNAVWKPAKPPAKGYR